MPVGITKWFDNKKGYGFIQPDQGGADIFVHISALEKSGMDTLKEGERVSYDLETRKGRSQAVNLRPYGEAH